MRVPFADVGAQDAKAIDVALEAIREVAQQGRFILGPNVEAFEQWLAAACGAAHAVGVASGTDALELSLRALGVGPGDAVVTPAFSFIAAAEAICAVGARPVFCDVEASTLNASERTTREAIDRARAARLQVKAIVPVHLFGHCLPLGPLSVLAAREKLAFIEDAAQALGARDEWGRRAGGVGDAACFSFFPAKNLGAWGDGGAVVSSRWDLADRVRSLRVHGSRRPYVHDETGRNSRLDAIQAAVLLAKVSFLSEWQKARTAIATRYLADLAELPLSLPTSPAMPASHAWHAFVVRTKKRDDLAHWLHAAEIETRVYYPTPLHRQPCFAGLGEPHLPVAEEVCRTALALPVSPALREDQQTHVVDCIRSFFERGS
jgi:dTDP-4-amino-4,6-dideoxygalactose transaminase